MTALRYDDAASQGDGDAWLAEDPLEAEFHALEAAVQQRENAAICAREGHAELVSVATERNPRCHRCGAIIAPPRASTPSRDPYKGSRPWQILSAINQRLQDHINGQEWEIVSWYDPQNVKLVLRLTCRFRGETLDDFSWSIDVESMHRPNADPTTMLRDLVAGARNGTAAGEKRSAALVDLLGYTFTRLQRGG